MFAAGVVFFPLLGAIIAGLFGRWIGDRGAQLVTCGGLILSALCSWVVLAGVLSGEPYKIELFRWIHAGTFEADWVIRVDVLAAGHDVHGQHGLGADPRLLGRLHGARPRACRAS